MAHLLQCSACCDIFQSRKEWLHHLIQDKHQSKSRREIFKWGNAERDCIFIIYATFPVASEDVLQFFSRGQDNIVTDFVYFSSQPKIGFMRFESKEKAAEIFLSVNGPRVRISDQTLELKKGVDYLDLEWEDRLSSLSSPPDFSQEQRLDLDSNQDVCKKEHEDEVIVEEPPIKQRRKSKVVPITIPDSEEEEDSILTQQYARICQRMQIQEKEYKDAIDLKDKLCEALSFTFPNSELKMFRNWYLGLKSYHISRSDLLLFLDYEEPTQFGKGSEQRTRSIEGRTMYRRKIELKLLESHFRDENGMSEICIKPNRGRALKEDQLGVFFFHTPSNLNFNIVNFPLYIPEVEICRLLEYLLTFDSRAKPLLTLIRYWSQLNKIRLTNEGEYFKAGFPPDPAILDWLVMLFLCCAKIIPSPRQVIKRPHDKFFYDGFDIGFFADPEFAQSFTSYKEIENDAHTLNVLILATKFFEFYPQQLGRGYLNLVFNTRDGEIILINDFLNYKCQLSKDEIVYLRSGWRHEGTIYRKNSVKSGEMSLTMINPLFIKHGFPICPLAFTKTVSPAMETTGRKLKECLKAYKEIEEGEYIDLNSVFQL